MLPAFYKRRTESSYTPHPWSVEELEYVILFSTICIVVCLQIAADSFLEEKEIDYLLGSFNLKNMCTILVGSFMSHKSISGHKQQPLCFEQIAASLNAEKLVLMTDVPGILKDKDDVDSKYPVLDIKGTRDLVEDGIIAGGMIPKV